MNNSPIEHHRAARRALLAAAAAGLMHLPLVWWWMTASADSSEVEAMLQETSVAVAAVPAVESSTVPEPEPAVSEPVPEPPIVEPVEPQPEVAAAPDQAAAPALGADGGSGEAVAAPLSLTWPTGNALLDLAGAKGLVLLVLDGDGSPVGSVDAMTGVFRTGLPSVLQSGDWDPETRLLPYPPARVLASLASQPRDHRVAVVVPRHRIAAWTATAAGRQATFQRRGNQWHLH